MSNEGSCIRKGICDGLDIVRKHAVWEVGSGNDISISLANTVDTRFASTNIEYVSQLIDSGTMSWNVPMITSLFDNATVSKILDIRIPFSGKDHIRWQPCPNGDFTVKSAYKTILNKVNASNGFLPDTAVDLKNKFATKFVVLSLGMHYWLLTY